MISEWKQCTIADLGDVVTGKTPSTKNPEFWDGSIHFVTPKDIQGLKHITNTERRITESGLQKVKGSILPPRAVCISCIGNIGYTGMTTELCVSNQQINSIIVNDDNDPDFVYYLIRNLWPFFKNYEGQSTTLSILNKTQFSKIPIAVPDKSLQRKIAAILSTIDEKIAVNTQVNDNLQQQAATIFRQWFVVNPETEKWPCGTFADLIDRTISGDWGKDAPTGKYTEMVYCIRGADIPEVKVGNKGKMPTRFILPKNYAVKKLVDGDIVVEISGGSPTQSTGRAAPVSESLLGRYDRGMVCTNFCKAITPKLGYSMFLYHYWQHLYDAGVFFGYENGTTGIKNLDINGFIETEEIVIPPLKIVARFDAICQAIANKVYANGLENERLANLRDTLLFKLMSGEIDVASIGS